MGIMHTIYGFKDAVDKPPRPCGMNNLLFYHKKPPSSVRVGELRILAVKRGYKMLVQYKEDEQVNAWSL